MSLKIGQRVEVSGKDCQGSIAYIGHPAFAAGKWIGVILDEPKGKNNGTIKGQAYFKCSDNHGMFVRQTQLLFLDESGNRIEFVSPASAVGSAATTPDDAGAARARSRLSSSRLSHAGSRSHLAAPSTENIATLHERKDVGESHIPAPTREKRPSFIETGIVETLKPQFTSDQPMGPNVTSSTLEEKLSNMQLSTENENLKAQVRDLTEKVEVLRMKRMQDKERMKEFEKTRIQLDQLIEFKTKVMESQAALQRDLQRARQDARDAITAREQYQEEMADLSETVEMATLDKEMAEEKAETLQIELEQLKETLEEQTLDLEILRNEMSDRISASNNSSGATPFEVKQLEQQNARLRETLVRMRDLSAHEKHEFQKLQKDLDQKKSEIMELGRTKEKLSARVEEMEHQIADLQEQVDAALGAEEMVEMLGQRKMALEEEVAELKEAVSDLEALQDMSDQLAESSKELELELREELDLALGSARDAQRHRDAALETLADRELTIAKFRELTQQMQDQCVQLQQRLQITEASKSATRGSEQQLAEILDFQKTFAESRAQTKAVDLELRRLDAEEARSHVRYLLSFMPPAFMNRGGDHDAILMLLLIPRMTQKTEIVISQVRDKYGPIEKIDRSTIVKGHKVEQYTFRSRLCAHMYSLQTALGSFESALSVCSTDNLLKCGAAFLEMAAQEKSLDSLIELAKRDQLDENIPMDGIEKCCAYFCAMYSVLFGESDLTNQARMVVNGSRSLGCACDAISTEATAIKILIDGEPSDIGLLCQHVETSCEVIQQHLKSARRRVPREHLQASSPAVANLGLDKHWTEQLINCYQHATKLMKTLQDLSKSALQAIVAGGELDTGLSAGKLKEMAAVSSEKIYDTEDLGPIATIKASLAVIQQTAANLAEKMAECENEMAMTGVRQQRNENAETINPIYLRAQTARKELEETKVLSRKLEARDGDIREARLALREKQEEISEMTLRKDLAEKRLTNSQHEHELATEKLKRKLEELQNQLKKKEKEFEETMDHLQTDIDSLESEKGQLKEKLKSIGKKGPSSLSGSEGVTSLGTDRDVSLPGSPSQDNDLLLNKIAALRVALKDESRQKRKLLSENLCKIIKTMDPIPNFEPMRAPDPKLQELSKKTGDLLRDVNKAMLFPVVPDLTRKKSLVANDSPIIEKAMPVYELKQQRMTLKRLQERAEQLMDDVRQESVKRTIGGRAETNFAVFPNNEMADALVGKSKPLTAEICMPYDGPAQTVDLPASTQELRKVHLLVSY